MVHFLNVFLFIIFLSHTFFGSKKIKMNPHTCYFIKEPQQYEFFSKGCVTTPTLFSHVSINSSFYYRFYWTSDFYPAVPRISLGRSSGFTLTIFQFSGAFTLPICWSYQAYSICFIIIPLVFFYMKIHVIFLLWKEY